MAILCVGIDLAKNVFALHGVNDAGKAELIRPAGPRDTLHERIASLPPCVLGMEARPSAHHWARLFQALGHHVRLIAPKFATPYRMTGARGKNDAADAAAICEAIQRPHMHFVPIKDRRAAVASDGAPRPPGVCRAAHGQPHLLQSGSDIHTVQELLGHADVATTMIYTRVLKFGGGAVRSPLDLLSSPEIPQSGRW